MKTVFMVLFIVLLVFILLSLAVSLFIVFSFAYPKRDPLEKELNMKRDEPLFEYSQHVAFEEFTVTTRDNLTLGTRLFMYHEQSKKFVILCHGMGVNQICASRYIEPYKESGYNVITYDHRGHGGNKRTPCTLSLKESQDLLEVIQYILDRFGEDAYIGIQGESMGGATVIGSLRYSPKIQFVTADCPYATLEGFVKTTLKSRHVPLYLFYTSCLLSKLFFGYSLSDIKPVEGINHSSVPMLLFHGLKDQVIPYTESEKIYAEYQSRKELVLVEGADHAQDIAVDRASYNRKVKEFLSTLQ